MQNNNSFWKTEKGKALIKLIGWLIFIVLLIIFIVFSENSNQDSDINAGNESNTDEIEKKSNNFQEYSVMIDKLLENNFEYKYVITRTNEKIVYAGIKAFEEDLGYRETNNEIIKYYINSTGIYKVNLDNRELIDNLYLDLDSNYFDLTMIFSKLNSYLYEIEENDNSRIIIYKDSDLEIAKVITDLDNITNISMTVGDITYEWEFTKIGECAKIVF